MLRSHSRALWRAVVNLMMCTLALAAAPASAAQASFPSRPITLVVPYGPGGETDIFARAIANDLGNVLGQPIVVLNRPGATGIVGTEFVARSEPDGYTLVFGTAATHALNVSVFKNLPYDPLKDFAPVAFVGSVPLVLLAHPSMPADVRELVARLKADPDKYFYGAAGISTSYLGMELFLNAASASAVHVPYKGTGEAVQDLIAGQVQLMGGSIGVGLPLVQAGKVRAIAVLGKERMVAAPDIPTLAEAGGMDLEVGTWNVVMAPAGTPQAVVARLNAAVNQVMRDPSVQQRLLKLGITPVADSTPASTADRVAAEITKWRQAFELSGAQPQ